MLLILVTFVGKRLIILHVNVVSLSLNNNFSTFKAISLYFVVSVEYETLESTVSHCIETTVRLL